VPSLRDSVPFFGLTQDLRRFGRLRAGSGLSYAAPPAGDGVIAVVPWPTASVWRLGDGCETPPPGSSKSQEGLVRGIPCFAKNAKHGAAGGLKWGITDFRPPGGKVKGDGQGLQREYPWVGAFVSPLTFH
jgi:hypothetical protein